MGQMGGMGMGQMGQMPGQMAGQGMGGQQMPQQQQYGNAAAYGQGYDQSSMDALEQQAQAQMGAAGMQGANPTATQQQQAFPGQTYQAPANQYY